MVDGDSEGQARSTPMYHEWCRTDKGTWIKGPRPRENRG